MKELIIQILKNKIFSVEEQQLQKDLIAAVERAKFSIPSEEEILSPIPKIDSYCESMHHYCEFIQYLRNKKPEDGK